MANKSTRPIYKFGRPLKNRSTKEEQEKEKPPEEPPEEVKDFMRYYGSNLQKELDDFVAE